jgi:hypothetical protein
MVRRVPTVDSERKHAVTTTERQTYRCGRTPGKFAGVLVKDDRSRIFRAIRVVTTGKGQRFAVVVSTSSGWDVLVNETPFNSTDPRLP